MKSIHDGNKMKFQRLNYAIGSQRNQHHQEQPRVNLKSAGKILINNHKKMKNNRANLPDSEVKSFKE